MTAVLAAPIRVVHDAVRRAERGDRVLQCDQGGVMRQIATHMPVDDPAGEAIRDEKEIRKAVPREPEICDVADDDLAWGGDGQRLHVIRRHCVRMARIRCLRVPTFAWHEAVVRAQYRKEMIASYGHAPRRQMVLEFTGADPRQRLPHSVNVRKHYGVRVSLRAVTPTPFVEGVARAPEDPADGREAVAGESVGISDGIPKFFSSRF